MRWWQNRWHRDDGQSMVELALVMPMLLLLLLGVIDLGMGFKTYIGLTNAAREGVRWVSMYPCEVDEAEARVAAEAERIDLEMGVFGEGGYTVGLSPSQSCYAAGDEVTYTVSYEYELLFGTLTGIPSIPINASATMVVLYDPDD